jgi:hypothetical protein
MLTNDLSEKNYKFITSQLQLCSECVKMAEKTHPVVESLHLLVKAETLHPINKSCSRSESNFICAGTFQTRQQGRHTHPNLQSILIRSMIYRATWQLILEQAARATGTKTRQNI